MSDAGPTERVGTIVVGGGQTGLTIGYFLARQGHDFKILDASERVGDAWRSRWDSLRLFTPARYAGLPGMPFPAPRHSFPTKDEMAAYLEEYAERFELPIHSGVRVDSVAKQGNRYLVTAGDRRYLADNVVVAMANYQRPRVPAFAGELDPELVSFHSSDYRNLSQLRDGPVLVVGAGNSGSEIALEIARDRPTWLSGRDTGHIPFRIEGTAGRLLVPVVLRFVFHRLLTIDTPIGRKLRPRLLNIGGPLVRLKPRDLAAAGVERVPKMVGVQNGFPLLEDGRVLEVANVIWWTGFQPNFSWIDLPVFGEHEPLHRRGVVTSAPGLYFLGLHFLYALSSSQIHGVARDAAHLAGIITARSAINPSGGRAQVPAIAPPAP